MGTRIKTIVEKVITQRTQERGKIRRFKKNFPAVSYEINRWTKDAEKEPKIHSPKKIKEIERKTYLFGGPLLREARKIKGIWISRGYASPIKISSEAMRCAVTLGFEKIRRNKDVIIESIQGELEQPAHLINIGGLIKEIVQIAKNAGYNRIKIRRPEYNPYYEENAEMLKEMWKTEVLRKKNKRGLGGVILYEFIRKGRPTVFELREIQLKHQKQMRELYYTTAKRRGFKKKEGQFLVKELK